MTSNVIKCKECDIVICEVLAFIQNKQNVMTADSLVKVCTSSFSTEEIEMAKTLLFDSLKNNQKKIQRKNAGKSGRNLNDMILIFRNTDPEELPIFVAKDLHRLPPLTFDHVDCTRLLKDILVLKNEISIIKETYATDKQLIELKNEVINLKQTCHNSNYDLNINRKRGGGGLKDSFYLDSGPMGLPFMEKKLEGRCSTPSEKNKSASVGEHSARASKQSNSRIETEMASPGSVYVPESCETELQQSNTGNSVRPDDQNGLWEKVSTYKERKQRKNRFANFEGKAVVKPDEKFRAADKKIPLFVHQVNKQTSSDNIVEYIKERTGLLVDIKKINMLKQKSYDAYKIYVPHTKVTAFLNDSFWPEGIKIRRFVYFNRNKYDENKAKKSNLDKSNNRTFNG